MSRVPLSMAAACKSAKLSKIIVPRREFQRQAKAKAKTPAHIPAEVVSRATTIDSVRHGNNDKCTSEGRRSSNGLVVFLESMHQHQHLNSSRLWQDDVIMKLSLRSTLLAIFGKGLLELDGQCGFVCKDGIRATVQTGREGSVSKGR